MSEAKLIRACLKIKNPYGVERIINSDSDSAVTLNLQDTVSLDTFKRKLLIEAGLSTSQEKKYLLWIFLSKNDVNLDVSPYSQIPNAILTDEDLRECILVALHLHAFLIFTLQKFLKKPPKQIARDLEFNVEGEVKEDREHLLNYDRPNHKIYPIQRNGRYLPDVECAFCGQLSSSEELREKVGPVYGPLKVGKKEVFMHELCAIWTPEIYQDEVTNRLKGMKEATRRCRKLTCTFCGEIGAGLGCFNNSCRATYHFLCAKTANCILVNSRFIAFCPDHAHEAP